MHWYLGLCNDIKGFEGVQMAAQGTNGPLGSAGAPPARQRTGGPLMGLQDGLKTGCALPPRSPRLGRLDMADTNQFPRTVASITRKGQGPQTHTYDDPDLSPLQFLLEVMHAKHLPLAT